MFYLRSNYKADEYHLPVVRRLLHKLCLQRMFLVYYFKKNKHLAASTLGWTDALVYVSPLLLFFGM